MNYNLNIDATLNTADKPMPHVRRMGRPDIYVRPTRLISMTQRSIMLENSMENESEQDLLTSDSQGEIDTSTRHKIVRFAESLFHAATSLGKFGRTA